MRIDKYFPRVFRLSEYLFLFVSTIRLTEGLATTTTVASDFERVLKFIFASRPYADAMNTPT